MARWQADYAAGVAGRYSGSASWNGRSIISLNMNLDGESGFCGMAFNAELH